MFNHIFSEILKSRFDFCKAACSVIDTVGITATSMAMCGECDALVAGACEAMGWGPLDPAADVCAVTMVIAFQAGCGAVIDAGGSFDTATCEKSLGC